MEALEGPLAGPAPTGMGELAVSGLGLWATAVVALQLLSPVPHLASERSGPPGLGGREDERRGRLTGVA